MSKIKILVLVPILLFCMTIMSFSVTEFKSNIKSSGGDYTSLSAWANAMSVDLTTVTTTKVFSISGSTVTAIADGAAVGCTTTTARGTCVHVSTYNNQILIKSITGTFANGNILTSTGATAVTLSNGGDSAIASAVCYAFLDTTPVTVSSCTTSTTNYVSIYTDTTAKHNGKWDDTKYRLVVPDANALTISKNNVRVTNLQIATSGTVSSVRTVNMVTVSGVMLSKNIIKNTSTGVGLTGICYISKGTGSSMLYNNIVYDFSTTGSCGMKSSDWVQGSDPVTMIKNNTVYNCVTGITGDYSSYRIRAINNLVGGGTTSYSGCFEVASDYNSSSDYTGTTPVTALNNKFGRTFTFLDVTNKDFHLAYDDTGARGFGVSLAGDFTDDIDGRTRLAAWDIGADDVPPTPTVTTITPSTWSNANPSTLTISGTSFYGDIGSNDVSLVRLDDSLKSPIITYNVATDLQIQGAIVPADFAPGTYNVLVRNSGGMNVTSTTMLTITSTAPAPTITGFTPVFNSNNNITTLTISGTNFYGGLSTPKVNRIRIYTSSDEIFPTGYSVMSDSEIRNVLIPAGTFPGSYDVSISAIGGVATLGKFAENPPMPVVTNLVPNIAHTGYNTTIAVTGLNFFGGTATPRVTAIRVQDMVTPSMITSYSVASDSVISNIVVPLGYPLGTYDLKVTVACSGISVTNTSSAVKILISSDPPTVTNIVPNILSNLVINTIAVTGTTFYGGYGSANVSRLELDTAPVTTTITSFNVGSDTQLTNCVIPAGLPAGTYNLLVYTSAGPNTTSTPKVIITTPVPAVSTITPNTGLNTAARTVTVYGTGFFGGTASANILAVPTLNNGTIITNLSSYSVASDTQIVNCGIPSGLMSGGYNIFLANTGGANTTGAKYYSMLDSTSAQVVTASGVTLTIPANTFSADAAVVVSKTATDTTTVSNANKIKYTGLKLNPNLGSSSWDLSSSLTEINIYPTTVSITSGNNVSLIFSFNAANITDSIVKRSLRPLLLNGTRWTVASDPYTLDEVSNTLTLNLNHFSVYRLGQYLSPASNLDTLAVFPNPVDFGTSARNSVKFTNLTLNPTIYIYTISGELVRTLLPDSTSLVNDGVSGKAEWDGKNEAGEQAARGMYLYLIKDEAGYKKVGKLGVQ